MFSLSLIKTSNPTELPMRAKFWNCLKKEVIYIIFITLSKLRSLIKLWAMKLGILLCYYISEIIPRYQSRELKNKFIFLKETFNMINDLSNINLTGVDTISIQTPKKPGWSIIPQAYQMINCVMKTAKFFKLLE